MKKRTRIDVNQKRWHLIVAMLLIIFLLSVSSCTKKTSQSSQNSTQPGQTSIQASQSSAPVSNEFPGDPRINKTPGIQNCHGYTWWMLTGTPANSKSKAELVQELERRGYKSYPYGANVTLKSGDVVIFEKDIDHSGIVVADGTLSHYRITQIQDILRDTGNLPEGSKAGDLVAKDLGIITDPAKLGSYPNEYEDWLISHSPSPDVTRNAIEKKKQERSFGFWHNTDDMNVVKSLLYPDKNPTITVWKLPAGIEVVPASDKMFQDEEKTFEAWFLFDLGSVKEKIRSSLHSNIKIYWNEPDENEVIHNGLVKGTDMKIGLNNVNVSAMIITPWGLISDTIKPEYAGKDVVKWLETKAQLTVLSNNEKPLTRLQLLQQTINIFVGVQGLNTSHDTTGMSVTSHKSLAVNFEIGATTWNGTSFSRTYQGKPSNYSSKVDLKITGEVSPEADLLYSINAKVIYDDDNGDHREYAISAVNVPLKTKSPVPVARDPNYKPVFIGYVEGPSVSSYVTSTSMEVREPRTAPDFRMWYDPYQWNDTEHTPFLLIVFSTEHISINDDPGYNTRK